MKLNLLFKILSRLILLILGWLFIKDFLKNGWYAESMSGSFYFVELSSDSSLGQNIFLIIRGLGILIFGASWLFYLVPSILGYIYRLKIADLWQKITFLSIGVITSFLLCWYLLAHSPDQGDEYDFMRLLIVGLLTALYALGLSLVYRGKNLLVVDFG